MNTITDHQVEDYLRAKHAEAIASGMTYASLGIEIRGFKDAPPIIVGRAYTTPAYESIEGVTITHALANLQHAMSTSSESQLLRKKAAELMAEADKLESQSATI